MYVCGHAIKIGPISVRSSLILIVNVLSVEGCLNGQWTVWHKFSISYYQFRPNYQNLSFNNNKNNN
jgi:hypothetical protein